MLDPSDYDDIRVLVAHPWLNSWAPLLLWIETGPGPRPFVRITEAKRASTGEPVPLSEIPLQYHNSRRDRELQRKGLLPMPWGPPPDHEHPPVRLPPHLKRMDPDLDDDDE